jgi:hypothetical protein
MKPDEHTPLSLFLSHDVWELVLQYIGVDEVTLVKLELVNTTLYNITSADKFWKTLWSRKYPTSTDIITCNYRHAYMQMQQYCSKLGNNYDLVESIGNGVSVMIIGMPSVGVKDLIDSFLATNYLYDDDPYEYICPIV